MLLGVVREEERPRCFLEMKHTPQAIGPATAKTQPRRAPSTHAAAVSRGQGLSCHVLCVLGECVCVWSPTTSRTKGAGPAWLPLFVCGSGGVRDVHVLICTRVVQIGVAHKHSPWVFCFFFLNESASCKYSKEYLEKKMRIRLNKARPISCHI